MEKAIKILIFALVTLSISSCSLFKKQGSAERQYLTKDILNKLELGQVENLRFYFEQTVVLERVDTLANGQWNVKKGDLEQKAKRTLKIKSKTLGKINYQHITASKKGEAIRVWFQKETDECGGVTTCTFELAINGEGEYRLISSESIDGRPSLVYQGVKYFLPENYREIKIAIDKRGGRDSQELKGVGRP